METFASQSNPQPMHPSLSTSRPLHPVTADFVPRQPDLAHLHVCTHLHVGLRSSVQSQRGLPEGASHDSVRERTRITVLHAAASQEPVWGRQLSNFTSYKPFQSSHSHVSTPIKSFHYILFSNCLGKVGNTRTHTLIRKKNKTQESMCVSRHWDPVPIVVGRCLLRLLQIRERLQVL